GTQIVAEHLSTTRVASEGTLLVPASQLNQVVGSYANVEISEGQLIDTTMVTTSGLLASPESVAVGATLSPGRLPASGLNSGDLVDLVNVADQGRVLVSDARVGRVEPGGGSST